jgi:hypothetical protein
VRTTAPGRRRRRAAARPRTKVERLTELTRNDATRHLRRRPINA